MGLPEARDGKITEFNGTVGEGEGGQNLPPGQVFSPVQQVIESDAVNALLSQLSGSRTFTAVFTSTEEASASTLLFSLRFLLFPFPSSPEQRRQIKHFLADKAPQEEQSAVKKKRQI